MQISPATQLHTQMLAFSKQKGQASDPQGMYKEIKRAIEKKERNRNRPEYVVLENYVESLTSKGILITQPFYGIDFESLLTVAGGTSNSSTWPCEVGISEFTLEKGETKHFHHFINPGEVNYSSKTVEYTVNNIHGIDSSMYSDGDDNYLKIYKKICKFVNTPEKIVMVKDKTLDEKCFRFLLSKIDIKYHRESLVFCELEDFYHVLNLFQCKSKSTCSSTTSATIPDQYLVTSQSTSVSQMISTLILPDFKKHYTFPKGYVMTQAKCYAHKRMEELFHCALVDARMIGNSMIMMAKDALLISPIFEDGKKKGKKLDLGNCNHFDDKDDYLSENSAWSVSCTDWNNQQTTTGWNNEDNQIDWTATENVKPRIDREDSENEYESDEEVEESYYYYDGKAVDDWDNAHEVKIEKEINKENKTNRDVIEVNWGDIENNTNSQNNKNNIENNETDFEGNSPNCDEDSTVGVIEGTLDSKVESIVSNNQNANEDKNTHNENNSNNDISHINKNNNDSKDSDSEIEDEVINNTENNLDNNQDESKNRNIEDKQVNDIEIKNEEDKINFEENNNQDHIEAKKNSPEEDNKSHTDKVDEGNEGDEGYLGDNKPHADKVNEVNEVNQADMASNDNWGKESANTKDNYENKKNKAKNKKTKSEDFHNNEVPKNNNESWGNEDQQDVWAISNDNQISDNIKSNENNNSKKDPWISDDKDPWKSDDNWGNNNNNTKSNRNNKSNDNSKKDPWISDDKDPWKSDDNWGNNNNKMSGEDNWANQSHIVGDNKNKNSRRKNETGNNFDGNNSGNRQITSNNKSDDIRTKQNNQSNNQNDQSNNQKKNQTKNQKDNQSNEDGSDFSIDYEKRNERFQNAVLLKKELEEIETHLSELNNRKLEIKNQLEYYEVEDKIEDKKLVRKKTKAELGIAQKNNSDSNNNVRYNSMSDERAKKERTTNEGMEKVSERERERNRERDRDRQRDKERDRQRDKERDPRRKEIDAERERREHAAAKQLRKESKRNEKENQRIEQERKLASMDRKQWENEREKQIRIAKESIALQSRGDYSDESDNYNYNNRNSNQRSNNDSNHRHNNNNFSTRHNSDNNYSNYNPNKNSNNYNNNFNNNHNYNNFNNRRNSNNNNYNNNHYNNNNNHYSNNFNNNFNNRGNNRHNNNNNNYSNNFNNNHGHNEHNRNNISNGQWTHDAHSEEEFQNHFHNNDDVIWDNDKLIDMKNADQLTGWAYNDKDITKMNRKYFKYFEETGQMKNIDQQNTKSKSKF